MKKIILSGVVAVALFASANIMAQDALTKTKQSVKTETKKVDAKLGEAKHDASLHIKDAKKSADSDVKGIKQKADNKLSEEKKKQKPM